MTGVQTCALPIYKLQEIIITDTTIPSNDLFKIISEYSDYKIRFHVAQEYDDFIAARIINEIAGIEPTVPRYNITKFRLRFLKRLTDIILSVFLLSIGFPIVYLLNQKSPGLLKKIWKVFKGEFSFVGIYRTDNQNIKLGKEGLIGLVHISKPERLSKQSINNLNNFYLQHFSVMLDFDIFIKYLFRKNSGK